MLKRIFSPFRHFCGLRHNIGDITCVNIRTQAQNLVLQQNLQLHFDYEIQSKQKRR